ncbi:hypothetical protein T01_10187 [Trichinella spiralis]|uniref:Uncharacterized protein n=1 Tax=Trichinella spiralis TaxID=6334 RepID=A0A0V1B463_TRISP|nr:hypothetical protein T01_10187 [Trichinella spiralis]
MSSYILYHMKIAFTFNRVVPSHVIISVHVGLLADVGKSWHNRCYFVNILEISLRHCHCCSDFES